MFFLAKVAGVLACPILHFVGAKAADASVHLELVGFVAPAHQIIIFIHRSLRFTLSALLNVEILLTVFTVPHMFIYIFNYALIAPRALCFRDLTKASIALDNYLPRT